LVPAPLYRLFAPSLQTTVGADKFIVANNYQLSGVKATMLESFDASEASINELLSLVESGQYIVQAHAGYAIDGADNHCDNVTNALSAFLIAAGENCFFACSRDWAIDPEWPLPGHSSDWMTWHPEYSKPLGPPTGPAKRSASGMWTRSFGTGTAVQFDSQTNTGQITWSS
jgi:hypothetical protein